MTRARTTPAPATRTRKETSELMVDLMLLIERKRGERLNQDEARGVRVDLLTCAKLLRKWTTVQKGQK